MAMLNNQRVDTKSNGFPTANIRQFDVETPKGFT